MSSFSDLNKFLVPLRFYYNWSDIMSKNNEIEAKIILTKEIYQRLCADFPVKSSFNQENYYFDSNNGVLKKANISCRIRLFDDHGEQTLKVPNQNPVQRKYHEATEINDKLTLQDAQILINKAQRATHFDFKGSVGTFLQDNFAKGTVFNLQTFSKTHRILARGPRDCELTFDDNTYPDDYEDFELEIENPNPDLIKTVLAILQRKYGFSQTPDETNQAKIARAFKHRVKM